MRIHERDKQKMSGEALPSSGSLQAINKIINRKVIRFANSRIQEQCIEKVEENTLNFRM